ncbi:MAG: FAD-dependent oxidoreductase, partial [Casimicrobiaceae bacterium]
MSSADYDVIVIGSGMTGLVASKRLAQSGLSLANIEGGVFGGLITNVNELEGEYTGSGADLASTLMMEAGESGCAMISESVTEVRRDGLDILVVTDAGQHRARAVVVASGARLKRLGVPGEAQFEYKGVSQCADCDGPMFRGQDAVVVGGGDSALQEALVLSGCCANVCVVHHRPELTAHPRWQQALRACSNVTLVPITEVVAIEGEGVVTAIRLRSLADG